MSDFTRSTAQMFFQNSLAEVVRKLRSTSGRSEEEAMEQYITDTKKEVASPTQSVKVIAVQKAAYFHMLGYSTGYAAFNILEVMADSNFSHKRIGYMAACTTFSEDTDVIPLMTALLRRDLMSPNQYEAGLALYCISTVCTPDLAQDIVADVVRLLNHPRTYVRKKAVLSLYKIFLQYPESLRPTYPRLKDKLDDTSEQCDTDPAVRGAVVCVLCELARRNPANFLGLAVPFYSFLSSVQSNWTLIKIVKVFGYFAPVEPRLGKKLAEPLTNLIQSTGAKSVQYECLLAVANGMGKVPALTKLAADKLRGFVADSDQNLKFLGLDALAHMVGENSKLLMDQRDTILKCLDDGDVTIRCKALEVLRDLVTRKNVVSTIDAMLDRCIRKPMDETWSNAVIACIVETARTDDYGLIVDFEWYLGVLLEISIMDITEYEHGELVENELVAILMRVNGARQFGVESLSELLGNGRLLRCDRERSSQWRILRAAAFACGEYPYWLHNKAAACESLLAEAVSLLPVDVQVACVTAVGKIAAYTHQPCTRHTELTNGEEDLSATGEDATSYDDVKAIVEGGDTHHATAAAASSERPARHGDGAQPAEARGMPVFLKSVYPDVQERTRLVFHQVMEAPALGARLYEKALPPIAEGAQEAIEAPAGLDLGRPFCENIAALMALSESGYSGDDCDGDSDGGDTFDFDLEYRIEQQKRADKHRREQVSAFYLKDADTGGNEELGERGFLVGAAGGRSRDAARGGSTNDNSRDPKTPSRFRSGRAKPTAGKAHGINRDLVRPANYVALPGHGKGGGRRPHSPEEDEATRKLRNIDVTRTLGADERLPEAIPYATLLRSAGGRKGGDGANGGVGLAASFSPGSAPPPPVILFEEALLMRVMLHIDGRKVRKDGTALRCTLEVTNLSVPSALNEVRVSLADTDAYPAGTFKLSDGHGDNADDGEAATGDAGDDTMPGKSVAIDNKIKSGTTSRHTFALKITSIPDSLLAPIPLSLEYLRDKKRETVAMQLQLRYAYFAKRAPLSTAPDDFNANVLHGALTDVPVISALVPCSKAALLVSVAAFQADLQLASMDVFKDAATYYGQLQGRKAQLELIHMAVLLREAEEDGTRGLSVSVRTLSTCLGELLVQDIANIVQSAMLS